MPALVIFNPPLHVRRMLPKGSRIIGQLSREVQQIQYRHADDNQTYQHDFETRPGVDMFAVEGPGNAHAILIVGTEGQSLWEAFE